MKVLSSGFPRVRTNIDDEDIPLGKFVRSLTGLDKSTAEQAFNEFLDTGLYTQEQITFVRYIIDWLVQYGTLARQEMAYKVKVTNAGI